MVLVKLSSDFGNSINIDSMMHWKILPLQFPVYRASAERAAMDELSLAPTLHDQCDSRSVASCDLFATPIELFGGRRVQAGCLGWQSIREIWRWIVACLPAWLEWHFMNRGMTSICRDAANKSKRKAQKMTMESRREPLMRPQARQRRQTSWWSSGWWSADANSQNDKLRRHVNHQEVTD